MVTLRAICAFSLLAVAAPAQQAPPARDFGKQLWTNTKGLFSTDNLVPLTVGVTASGASSIFDQRVQNYFGEQRRAEWIGTAGNIIGNPVTIGASAGALFFISYKTPNQRFRAMSFDLTQGFLVDLGMTAALKAAIRRERPDGSNNLSLPSGHASATATAATIVSHYYPKATIPAYLVAAFTGFGRIEKNRHWLSDTVAGAVQGIIIGRTVVRGRSIFRAGRFEWFPAVSSRGVVVNASLRLGSKPTTE